MNFVRASAALGGVLFGYDTAVVNGALFQLERYFNLGTNSNLGAVIVSVAIAAAFVSAMFGGYLADKFGRRRVIAAADVLFIVGAVVQAVAPSVVVIILGRIAVGLGIGIASVVVPVYLAEVTSAADRGRILSVNSVCICGSQFLAAVTCGLLVHFSTVSVGWRYMFGLGAVPAGLQLIATLAFLPETPRWLQQRGQLDAAVRVAERFGLEMATTVEHAPVSLMHPSLRRQLRLAVGLQVLQQFCGINTVMYYSANVLKDVGFNGDEAPVLLGIPLAFTNALFTLLAMAYADKAGRRPLLIVSLIGCSVATTAMAVSATFQEIHVLSSGASGWAFVCFLLAYLMFFAPGLGAMPWLVMSEVFPTYCRSAACGIATMANWGSNAIVSLSFPILVRAIGIGPTFLVITLIEITGLALVQRFVPETKGLTLEEISQQFRDEESLEMRAVLVDGAASSLS